MRTLILFAFCIVASPLTAQTLEWEQAGQTAWPYRPDIRGIAETTAGILLACPYDNGLHRPGDRLYYSVDEGASWTEAGLDEPLVLCALAVTENAVLVGTREGIFRSEDGGTTWEPGGLPGRKVLDVEEDAQGELWAVAEPGETSRFGFYRSDDGGATWEEVASSLDIGQTLGSFPTLEIGPEGALFVSAQYGLFLSVDDGTTWTEAVLDSSSGFNPTTDVAFAPDGALYVGATISLSALGERGVYRSLDAGLTWSLAHAFEDYVFSVAVSADGTVFVGVQGGGLFRSPDGDVWEPGGLNALRRSVHFILPDGDGTPSYLGTDKGVYRSAGGAEWAPYNEGFADTLFVYTLASIGDQIFAGAHGDLYHYNADTDRWELPSNESLQTTRYTNDLWTHGSALFFSTGYGFFRSDDAGSTWVRLPVPRGGVSAFTATGDGTFVAGTSVSTTLVQYGDVYFSFDGGDTWTASEGWNESPAGIPYSIAETPSGALLVGAVAGKVTRNIYRSDDGGGTWVSQFDEAAQDFVVTPGEAIVAITSEGYYRSLDDGLSWEATDPAGSYELEVTLAGGVASVHFDGDVHFSTDEGLTWQQVSTGLDGIALASDSNNFVYVGTQREGVFRSSEPVLVGSEADRYDDVKGSGDYFVVTPTAAC